MPVSLAGSLVLHGLVLGVLLLLAWLGWAGFQKPAGALPVVPVTLAPGPKGESAVSPPRADGGAGGVPLAGNPNADQPAAQPEPKRPSLDPGPAVGPLELPQALDVKRPFRMSNPRLAVFDEVNRALKRIQGEPQRPGQRKDDPGKEGGKDGGTGPSDGKDGGKRNARVERMLRWTLTFDTRTGADYLRQLRALDFFLAIPTDKDGKTYKVIRDLSGREAARLLDEDVSANKRIFWIDDRPESVQSLMKALKCDLQPRRFVAFMPESLEEKLFKLEKEYRGRAEKEIGETVFDVRPDGQGGYKVAVRHQTGR
jgi:hypothetical protein